MAVAHLVPNAFGLRTFGPKRQMDPTKKSIRTKCVGDQMFRKLIALGIKSTYYIISLEPNVRDKKSEDKMSHS